MIHSQGSSGKESMGILPTREGREACSLYNQEGWFPHFCLPFSLFPPLCRHSVIFFAVGGRWHHGVNLPNVESFSFTKSSNHIRMW
jgi:hypothetical protein